MKKIYSWTLNFERMMRAVEHSYIRNYESRKLNCDHEKTYKRNFNERITQEVIGTLGELAVLDFFNVKRDPLVNTFHSAADVLDDIEVRSTNYRTGHLILRHHDIVDRKYVFCTVGYDAVRIIGWKNGKDGMTNQYYRSEDKTKSLYKNPRVLKPAWFIPQEDLNCMEVLKYEKTNLEKISI
jgi:hypothetical protein